MDEKYKVSKNILYNFIGQGVLLSLGILTTPILIHKLGIENFGILILITSIVSYFSILDFGFGTAIIKNISESLAKQDNLAVKKIVATSLFTFSIIGLIGALLIICSTNFIVDNLLHVSPVAFSTAKQAFYISSVSFFISMISVVLVSIPSAFQRMDIINKRNIFLGILNTIGTISLLVLGFGLIEIVLWNIFITIIATIIFLILISRVFPKIPITIGFDKETFLKLFKFGSFKFISNISGQIIFELDRFLISLFKGVSSIAFYDPPMTLVQKGFSALLNISSATFPAISESSALGDQARVKSLYLRMSRLVVFVISPLLLFLFVAADQIIYFWLGQEFVSSSSPILRILSVAYLFVAVTAAPVTVVEGLGKPKITAFFGVLGAGVNLVAALILIPIFGIKGAAIALLINCFSQVPFFVWYVSKNLVKVSMLDLIKQSYLKPASAAIISAILLYLFLALNLPVIIALIIGTGFFGICYLLINILIKTFEDDDKLVFIFLYKKILTVIKK